MTPPFDPYHRWLGVRREEQPADHYRLLGLARFEDDIEVIRDAAERQIAHVRRYAAGEHAEDARRILNELGNAKACLIVQDKKVSYDATLRSEGVVGHDVRHEAKTPGIDLLASSHSAPILLDIVEPNPGLVASTLEADDPLRLVPQPTATAYSTAPTPAKRRPKTLAPMQALRQPQRPKASPGRLGVRQVDDFLKRIAGDDTALLYVLLRVFAFAVAITIPAVCILAAGSWAMHWSSDETETVARTSVTFPSPSPTPPTLTPSLPPTPTPLVLAPVGDAEVEEEKELRLELALADAGSVSDSVRFEFVGASHGATLDPRGVFTWTPTEAQGPGTSLFQVRAVASSDAAQPRVSEPLAFQVMVREVNQPPQCEPTNEQQGTVGDELKLSLRATDPDLPANILTFIPLNHSTLGDLNPATGEFRWTPSDRSATAGYIDLVVEVRDNGTPPQSAQQMIRIRVHPKPLEPQITNSIGMTLKLIPAGEFLMGSTYADITAVIRKSSNLPGNNITPESFADEQPQHRVRITQPFYMATTEVTQGQWQAVMNTTPWRVITRKRSKKGKTNVKEGSDTSATYISWEDADQFCRRLSATESRTYRLPREAEWEYACRAGSTTAYCFGDPATSLTDYAWCCAEPNEVVEEYAYRVGQKRANDFGLFDMHGNVLEWCSDWYDENYYATPDATTSDPVGPATGSYRVRRGGRWHDSAANVRSAARSWDTPSLHYLFVGFRVALDTTSGATIPEPTIEPKPIESAEEISNTTGRQLKLNPAEESLMGSPVSGEITRSGESSESKDDLLSRIYGALRVTDVKVEELRRGERVTISYKLTNTSKDKLPIPLDTSYSPPRNVIGTRQHWVERQGTNSTIPGISKQTARNGKKYAAGGGTIVAKATIAPGESLTFQRHVDTTGFPPGRYSYYVVYQSLSNNALDSKTVEFVVLRD